MKKILLFMLPVMALFFTSCEKNNENELSGDDIIQFEDPNFLKALLCVQEIEMFDTQSEEFIMRLVDVDRNKDGQISVNEAQNVLALPLFTYNGERKSFNVQSMPEIKYFTSLTYLDCFGNQLTSLDISNNTALTYLDCGDNYLTELDVNSNTALAYLACDGNQLTELDLRNNTALRWLLYEDNPLTKIILNKNHILDEFYIQQIIEEYGDIIEYVE